MSKGWDITNNVERRIAEAKQGTSSHIEAKSLDVPVHQPRVHAKVALPTGKNPVVRPSKHPALTKRERKVKDILLQELQRLSEWKTLNYAEKKHLDETINVVYIDNELASMRRRMKFLNGLKWLIVGFVAMIAYTVVDLVILGSPLDLSLHILMPALFALEVGVIHVQGRSLQRKMFIYEALRELSDADEEGLALNKVINRADDLINAMVAQEEEADVRYPLYAMHERAN